jgi:Tfp pilus assembly protein PilO
MCLAKLFKSEPKTKEEDIMLTEIIINGEHSAMITEKITEKMASYIGQYFKELGIKISVDGGVRYISMPSDSMAWFAVGNLTLSLGGRELKVIV